MNKILFVLIWVVANCDASFEVWQLKVDEYYSNPVHVRVNNPFIEYQFLKEKVSLSAESISKKEILSRISELKGKEIKRRESDKLLGFLFCDVVGCDAKVLLSKCGRNPYLETYILNQLVLELFGNPTGPEKGEGGSPGKVTGSVREK